MVEIKKVKWGVANHYSNPESIEINEKLDEPQFKELKQRIIRHELEHTKQKSFWGQRKVDSLTSLTFIDLLPFYRKYPKTFFQQHSPITYKDNTLFFEWSLIILYTFYLLVGSLIFWLISLFSKDSAFFWSVTQNMVIILIIVFFVYFGGKILFKYINEEFSKEVIKE